ncbi:hypothetical protein P4E94_16405 [Pontiellaceae bacterium B12219]|nr:hypothetical protein [Pontiellaceae bacterium B12219]
MKIIGVIFGLIAILGILLGIASLSEATMGVGIIAASAVAAMFSRIAQADAHHLEQKRKIQDLQTEMYEVKRILAYVHKVKVD